MTVIFTHKEKKYETDPMGFIADFQEWDTDFAEGLAGKLKMPTPLTREHWDVIDYIRETFVQTGRCPTIFETAKNTSLHRRILKKLFPTGYLRGACLLAGITYKEGFVRQKELSKVTSDFHHGMSDKVYRVDVRGFLVDPMEWNEAYAEYKAFEMKIPGGKLSKRHWEVLHFLRKSYEQTKIVPTIHETCDFLNIEFDELEQLFPDGYHRGAVKIAGLKVR
ncbi:MAG: TusE/DsrC/DsvC family sulfur relay protein [Desulfobacterales bacterium]|jgi:tRNA 2-thiouridine synthesizing protein E|nr:TusE/DsrC/DsvC family sulfur relay protein [Desulfobacterales bacterium]